jgi:hypothetical protein
MTLAQDKKFNFLLVYQCVLAVASVFVFFTYLDLYLPLAGISPWSPVRIVALFCIASVPLLILNFSQLKNIPLSLVAWCVGYILISLFSLLSFPVDEEQYRELRVRVLSVIFMLSTALIFSSRDSIVQTWARRAIFIAVFVAIFNLIYNILEPTAFRVDVITTSFRPAGFYVDANKTSCALIGGMIFSIGLLAPKYRFYFVLLIGIVNLITFSRGGVIAWFLIAIIIFKARLIPSRHLLFASIGLGVFTVFILVAGQGLLDQIDHLQATDKHYRQMFERLNMFEGSSTGRKHLLRDGLKQLRSVCKCLPSNHFGATELAQLCQTE